MIRCRPVALAMIALFLWVSACTSYRQIHVSTVGDYDIVAVRTTDGEEHKLRGPEFEADSLRGRIQETARLGGYRWSDSVVAIPLESVAEVGVRKTDGGTATAVAVVGGMVLLSFIAIAATSDMPFK